MHGKSQSKTKIKIKNKEEIKNLTCEGLILFLRFLDFVISFNFLHHEMNLMVKIPNTSSHFSTITIKLIMRIFKLI